MVAIKQLSPQEAFALSEQGVLLVDVREADEVAQKRYQVANYLHLPLSQLAASREGVAKRPSLSFRRRATMTFLIWMGASRLGKPLGFPWSDY